MDEIVKRLIFLIPFKSCYECASDLISFPVGQKYEIINANEKNFENRSIITTVVP